MSDKSDSEEAETTLRFMSKPDKTVDEPKKPSPIKSVKEEVAQKVLLHAKVSHKRLALLIKKSDELVE